MMKLRLKLKQKGDVLFLILLMSVVCYGVLVVGFSEVEANEQRNVPSDIKYGMLEGMTFNPSFMKISGTNFSWENDRTVFQDDEGKELTPRLFLQRFHGSNVEIFVEPENFVRFVRPIYY